MKRKRIFIAINLPENIKNKLANYQKRIEKAFGVNLRSIRWTKKENLHITLEFLGYLTENEILKVKEILKSLTRNFYPFDIKLIKICYGPKEERIPRMVWAVGERKKEVISLKEKLDKELKKFLNFESERREFIPHITLGRIRKWQWKAIPLDERPEIRREINLEFKTEKIDLMESKLLPQGAKYLKLKTFPFKK